jgi:hypothetical protein
MNHSEMTLNHAELKFAQRKTTARLMLVTALVAGLTAAAAPPGGPARDTDNDGVPDRAERFGKRARMMSVVSIAEALELSEADALKMSEKLKTVEDRRQPVRQAMHQAMRAVKAAADGDASALREVDANILTVLDGRAQMAAMDKELFGLLSKDLSAEKKAKLALVLARLGQEHGLRGGRGGRGGLGK